MLDTDQLKVDSKSMLVMEFKKVDFKEITKLYKENMSQELTEMWTRYMIEYWKTKIHWGIIRKSNVTCRLIIGKKISDCKCWEISKDGMELTPFGKKILNRIMTFIGKKDESLYFNEYGEFGVAFEQLIIDCDDRSSIKDYGTRNYRCPSRERYDSDCRVIKKQDIRYDKEHTCKYKIDDKVVERYRNDLGYLLWEKYFYYQATPEQLVRYYDRFDEEAVKIMGEIFKTEIHNHMTTFGKGWLW